MNKKTYDEATFGSSSAAKVLAVLLNETSEPRVGRLVSRNLVEFDEAARLIFNANMYTNTPALHIRVRKRIAEMVYQQFRERFLAAANAGEFPDKVISFTLNVMAAKRKVLIERITGVKQNDLGDE